MGSSIRSDLYDAPLVVSFIDHVGPIRTSGKTACRYVLTAVCPFSGWGWAIPVVDNGSESTAQFLTTRVFLDTAGFPVILRHDRSTSFINDVIRKINASFSVTQVAGAAWRPQTQGPVETTHRRLGHMLRAICETNPNDWEFRVPFAVWG